MNDKTNENPLQKYFRKPALYVQLPTKGKFNPEIPKTVLDEIGILPMTAIDDLTMRNPDGLLNGEALISVIESCCPSIPNVRNLCNIDVEALYLAIQYATNGKEITHKHKCTKCEVTSDFNVDIDYLLNKFPEIESVEPIEYEDLKIHMRPPSLESVTRVALIELEERRLLGNLNIAAGAEEGNELEISKKLYGSFKRVAEHNVELLVATVNKIESPEGEVTDSDQILEFLRNIPKSTIDKMNDVVKGITKKPDDLAKFDFVCPECSQKDTVNIETNPVNFS